MKKLTLLSFVVVATLPAFAGGDITTPNFANDDDIRAEIETLKEEISSLKAAQASNKTVTKKAIDSDIIKKLEKKIKANHKKASEARTMANGNHLKFDVDFRTTMDKIDYKLTNGTHAKNNSLLANRLLVNMKYDAGDKVRFYGTAGFNKAFGETLNNQQNNMNYKFDWVTNEALSDDSIKLKEAYWLYSNNTFFGKDISWTASIGRRPSVDGLGANFREGQNRKSAIASTVNVQFDGASFRWNLNKVTPLTGSWIKFCLGRGLTSAKPRFSNDGLDYAKDESSVTSNMIGMIFVPYDDGQYSLHTNYAKSRDMIGFDKNQAGQIDPSLGFKDFGNLDLATVMVKADGIGDGINDFLDDTILFASYSQSKTDPKNSMRMLGSNDSKTGHSAWIGLQMPGLITDNSRFGIEYNKGSKYWRSVTYGEDTMIGSKVAARGDAKEVYFIQPLTKSLSMSARYTIIDYDYTGSNAFFGEDGVPMDINSVPNAVKSANDFRVLFRYKY